MSKEQELCTQHGSGRIRPMNYLVALEKLMGKHPSVLLVEAKTFGGHKEPFIGMHFKISP